MSDFGSLEEALAQMEKDMYNALLKLAYELQTKGREYIIEKIYSTYTPTENGYNRTDEFMNAIQVKVVPIDNGFEATIYIADDVIHSQSNWKDGTLTVAPKSLMYNSNRPEAQNKTLANVAKYFAEGWGYGEQRFGRHLDVMLEIANYVDSGQAQKDLIEFLSKEYDIV